MSLRFDPTGKYVATGSLDKHIFLWHVYGNCENTHVFKGHKNAVLQIDWSLDGHQVCSASADKTVCVWDVESGRRLKKFAEHTSHVNSVCTAGEDAGYQGPTQPSELQPTISADCGRTLADDQLV